jgi:hypothetical protein
MKFEYCCKCACETGRAGAGDDSLYTENDGPFCEDCFPEKQEAAQPAVPDAITDRSESPEYIQGWNDCRSLMLEMRKP